MADIFSESVDPTRDLPKERMIEVADGTPFIIEQFDPHGFWRVRRQHGQVPDHLKGDYTSAQYARSAVELYVNSLPKKAPTVAKASSDLNRK